MFRFSKTKIAKETFYGVEKPINIWDFNVDNTVISNLVETKNISKYLIGFLDKVIRLPKMSGYVKTSKLRFGDKDENKLMSVCIDNEKLLEK